MANIDKLKKKILENTFFDSDTQTLFYQEPGISYDVLKGLAKKRNFTLGQTKSGAYISIPTVDKYSTETYKLYDDFLDTYTLFSKNYETLLTVYNTLDQMDENVSEVSLILDTYVGEVLAQGFVENPLNIKISNNKAQQLVQKVLYKNKIHERLPSLVRNLAKYGNAGLLQSYPYLEKWMSEEGKQDFKRIDVLEDLVISYVHPKRFKVNTDEFFNVVNYEVEDDETYLSKMSTTSTASKIKKIWQPWQFTHLAIYDSQTDPYGKSMLWSMRSAFDQLTTLEALLGISRASNVQRLVFYVPMPNGVNITDAAGYMSEFRSQYLNSIFSDTSSPKAGRKLPGAMSILTLPEAFDGKKVTFSTIEGKIDLAATDDVEYFLDKILRNSSLPKGYLVGEDVITTAQTLEAQDLKLKRALIPLKKALLNGIMNLVENILTHAGYDVSTLDIEVSLNEPIQIPADVIQKYSDICELMKAFMELNAEMTDINKFQFLIKLGLPADLASLVCGNTSINVLNTADELGKFLVGQKAKDGNKMLPSTPELGECVKYKVNNHTFNLAHPQLYKTLNEVCTYTKNTVARSLKEDYKYFNGTKKYLDE